MKPRLAFAFGLGWLSGSLHGALVVWWLIRINTAGANAAKANEPGGTVCPLTSDGRRKHYFRNPTGRAWVCADCGCERKSG